MRVYLANDTSSFHAGSRAVIQCIEHQLEDVGHQIVHRAYRPNPPEPELLDDVDVLLVNGEGFMRYERRGWEATRIRRTREAMIDAKNRGKLVFLVNSVWQEMSAEWTPVLKSCDGVWVREVSSSNEMWCQHGVRPTMSLDLSYWAPWGDAAELIEDCREQPAVGWFYRSLRYPGPLFEGWPSVQLGGTAQPKEFHTAASWGDIVERLESAELYVTGQHHGVYAACIARCPFIPVKVNTHKLTGLFEQVGVRIPIVEREEDFNEALAWARSHDHVYRRLFDWMEEQPEWKVPF
jgi:hypothetical protein